MARYTVEVLATSREGLEAQIRRARTASEASAAEGVSVRYVASLFMLDDELCLHLFEGPSPEAVRAVAADAGLDPIRVVETLTDLWSRPGREPTGGT